MMSQYTHPPTSLPGVLVSVNSATSLPPQHIHQLHQHTGSLVDGGGGYSTHPNHHPGVPSQYGRPPPVMLKQTLHIDLNDGMNTKEKTPMCLVNELARFNKVRDGSVFVKIYLSSKLYFFIVMFFLLRYSISTSWLMSLDQRIRRILPSVSRLATRRSFWLRDLRSKKPSTPPRRLLWRKLSLNIQLLNWNLQKVVIIFGMLLKAKKHRNSGHT